MIEYLAEVDRRRLYLDQACASLRSFCIERLGYSEDEAGKRVRVAHLARQLPRVLDELRDGSIHLTGLFLLAPYLTEQNVEALLSEARGLSRHAIEHLIARAFPRPNVASRIHPVAAQSALPSNDSHARSGRPATTIGPGTGRLSAPSKLEPLSASSYRVQFTAGAELHAKIEQARELHIERKLRERAPHPAAPVAEQRRPETRARTEALVSAALCKLGFRKTEVARAVAALRAQEIETTPELLLRAALAILVPVSATVLRDDEPCRSEL